MSIKYEPPNPCCQAKQEQRISPSGIKQCISCGSPRQSKRSKGIIGNALRRKAPPNLFYPCLKLLFAAICLSL
jgi:hypothetical protein